MAPSADAGESQHGSVFSVSGPVVVAEHMIGCAMYELVCLPCVFPPPDTALLGLRICNS